MDKYDRNSILGGEADLAHHYLTKPLALRWWLPGGVLLTTEQHNLIHSSDLRGKRMQSTIETIKGLEWLKTLQRRKNIIVKNLELSTVLKYLEGEIEDYI